MTLKKKTKHPRETFQRNVNHLSSLKQWSDKHLIKLSPESPQNETPTKSKIWEVSVTVGIRKTWNIE